MSKQINSQPWKKKMLLATSSLTDSLFACCSVAETERKLGVSGRCRSGKLHSYSDLPDLRILGVAYNTCRAALHGI